MFHGVFCWTQMLSTSWRDIPSRSVVIARGSPRRGHSRRSARLSECVSCVGSAVRLTRLQKLVSNACEWPELSQWQPSVRPYSRFTPPCLTHLEREKIFTISASSSANIIHHPSSIIHHPSSTIHHHPKHDLEGFLSRNPTQDMTSKAFYRAIQPET